MAKEEFVCCGVEISGYYVEDGFNIYECEFCGEKFMVKND